jgi:hypothetical protein
MFNFAAGFGFTTYSYSFGFSSLAAGAFPRLSPNNPADPFAFNTGIPVRRGDLLNFDGSGAWGSTQVKVKEYLDGFFTVITWNTNCSQVSLDGYKDSALYANPENGQAAGLFASDGVEAFLIGSSIQDRPINNDGMLRLGINAPASVPGACASARISALSITRCEDGVRSYPCPY